MLYIVLPAYNEALAIPQLIADLEATCRDELYRIIVVNDGSTDQTAEIATRLAEHNSSIHVVNHDHNKGLGAALLSGFNEVRKVNLLEKSNSQHPYYGEYDIIITMDSDNTHPPDRIPLMIERIKEGADLVIASRYAAGGRQIGLRAARKVLSRCAGLLMGVVFPIPGVRDYSCGYRAYRLQVIEQGMRIYGNRLIESKSFAAMVEVLIKLAPLCRVVEEIPLILHYERKTGQSKMKVMKTIWGYFRLIYGLKREARGARGTIEWLPEK